MHSITNIKLLFLLVFPETFNLACKAAVLAEDQSVDSSIEIDTTEIENINFQPDLFRILMMTIWN